MPSLSYSSLSLSLFPALTLSPASLAAAEARWTVQCPAAAEARHQPAHQAFRIHTSIALEDDNTRFVNAPRNRTSIARERTSLLYTAASCCRRSWRPHSAVRSGAQTRTNSHAAASAGVPRDSHPVASHGRISQTYLWGRLTA